MKNSKMVMWMSYFTMLLISLISFSANAQKQESITIQVQKAHQSFMDGILAEDYKLVDQLLAEDVTLGFPHGGFSPKQDYINALKNGQLFYDSAVHEYSSIRVYNNTGIVNGKSSLVFRYKDEKGQWFKMLEHLTFTTVYVIDSNTVKMVAWQSNRPNTDITVKLAN